MTDDQILAEFLRIEKIAYKTPQGPDHKKIAETVAEMSGRPVSYIRALVLENTFMGPN